MHRQVQGLHLDHEVPDAAMEGGAGVVPTLSKDQKVLAGARGNVTVQLQVDVPAGRGTRLSQV